MTQQEEGTGEEGVPWSGVQWWWWGGEEKETAPARVAKQAA